MSNKIEPTNREEMEQQLSALLGEDTVEEDAVDETEEAAADDEAADDEVVEEEASADEGDADEVADDKDEEPAWFREYKEQATAREKELREELAAARAKQVVEQESEEEELTVDDRVAKLEAELKRRDDEAAAAKLHEKTNALLKKHDLPASPDEVLNLVALGRFNTVEDAVEAINARYEEVAKRRAAKYKQGEGGVQQPKKKVTPKKAAPSSAKTVKGARKGFAQAFDRWRATD